MKKISQTTRKLFTRSVTSSLFGKSCNTYPSRGTTHRDRPNLGAYDPHHNNIGGLCDTLSYNTPKKGVGTCNQGRNRNESNSLYRMPRTPNAFTMTRESSGSTILSMTNSSPSFNRQSQLIINENDNIHKKKQDLDDEEEEEEEDFDIDYLVNSMITVEKYNVNNNLCYENTNYQMDNQNSVKEKYSKDDRWKPMYVYVMHMKFLCC